MENGNPYIVGLIAQVGMTFTAICSLLAVIIQVKSNNKTKKNGDMMTIIDSKLDKLKADSDASDKELRECITEHHLRYFKDQLVITMSKIEAGYIPTIEEKHILHEQKAKYNELGGDSYVDEMWDNLHSKGLL